VLTTVLEPRLHNCCAWLHLSVA